MGFALSWIITHLMALVVIIIYSLAMIFIFFTGMVYGYTFLRRFSKRSKWFNRCVGFFAKWLNKWLDLLYKKLDE